MKYYKFLYAVQSPMTLAFSPMELIDEAHIVPSPMDDWETLNRNFVAMRFTVDFATFIDSSMLFPEVPYCRMGVLVELESVGGTTYTTQYDESSFESFCSFHGEDKAVKARTTRGTAPKRPKDSAEDAIKDLPWLAAALEKSEGFTEKAKGNDEQSEDTSEDEVQTLSDDVIEAALADLENMKALLLEEEEHSGMVDFRCHVIGSKWTVLRKKKGFDGIGGEPTNEYSLAFLERRIGQKSVQFDTGAYGVDVCCTLARAFCHKMQFFMDREPLAVRGASMPFAPDVFDTYVEPSEFAALAQLGNVAFMKRVRQIRGFLAP